MSIKVINIPKTKKNLKKMLEENNITPKEVQQKLELGSVQAVYKWTGESGEGMPSLENLILLSSLLNCTIEDILVIEHIYDSK